MERWIRTLFDMVNPSFCSQEVGRVWRERRRALRRGAEEKFGRSLNLISWPKDRYKYYSKHCLRYRMLWGLITEGAGRCRSRAVLMTYCSCCLHACLPWSELLHQFKIEIFFGSHFTSLKKYFMLRTLVGTQRRWPTKLCCWSRKPVHGQHKRVAERATPYCARVEKMQHDNLRCSSDINQCSFYLPTKQ